MPVLILGLIVVLAAGSWAHHNLSHPDVSAFMEDKLVVQQVPGPTLKATYFGTSTLLLDGEHGAVMVDGFFSRPSKLKLVTMWPLIPDVERIAYALNAAKVDYLDAILVSHSHHDHAMDSATVARMKGAALVGSKSSRFLALGEGFTGPFHEPSVGVPYSVQSTRAAGQQTGFEVMALEGKHSPDPVFPGTIDRELKPANRHLYAFKEGGGYTYVIRHSLGTVVVQPSANYLCGKLRGIKAEVVFLSIGRLGKQDVTFARNYWREVVLATEAKLVIPVHWDDFTLPLSLPLKAMPPIMDDIPSGLAMVMSLGQEFEVPVKLISALQPFDILPMPPAAVGADAKRRVELAKPCVESID